MDNNKRNAILARLSEISGDSTDAIGQAKAIAESTSDKAYRRLMSFSNVTSYSKLSKLHECPRSYELAMYRAVVPIAEELIEAQPNYDFAFGHAVGAGIQTYGATRDLVAAQFAAFLAWKAPYDGQKTDKRGNPAGKSLPHALIAVEKFQYFMQSELEDWNVAMLPDGRPAVEVAFAVDTGNGYFHFGHIDAIIQHRETKRLAVWEGKTGSAAAVDAKYANSYQALGYSVVVDAISKALGLPSGEYDVFYIYFSSATTEFTLLPFTKNRSQRAEWLQDLLLDHAAIDQYKSLNFFPKRGDSCVNTWGRTCQWFGNCHMRNSSLFPNVNLDRLEGIGELHAVDFSFTLQELIEAQKR